MQTEPTWKNFLGRRKYANVVIDGSPKYRLIHQPHLLSLSAEYILYGPDSQILRTWSSSPYLITINESPKLQYQIAQDSSLAHFITEDNTTTPAILTSSASSRSLKFQDMEFKHKDYDSHIHFRCPDHKAHQAILIANLLFSPLYTSNG
ncbi:MAG: hypothetical protein ACSHX6_00560 [Akkermansiaceae bacterium]